MNMLGSMIGSLTNFVKGNPVTKTIAVVEAGAAAFGGLLELFGVHLGTKGWKQLLAGAGLVALLFGTLEWVQKERVAGRADQTAHAVSMGDLPVSAPDPLLPDPHLAAKDAAVAEFYAQPTLKTYDPTTGRFLPAPQATSPEGTLLTPVTPDGKRGVPQVAMPGTPNTYDDATAKIKQRFMEGIGTYQGQGGQ